jgi:hypothetical protein
MGSDLSSMTTGSGETRHSMASWSQRVESYDTVPQAFQGACRAVLAEMEPFPYVIFAPALPGGRRKTSATVIAEVGDALHIWERSGDQIKTTAYRMADVSVVEEGHILLYSWLTLRGVTLEGEAATTTVPFNTVSTPYFLRFINRFRPEETAVSEADWQAELDRFNFLDTVNYKFMNFARDSLLPGQATRQIVWQPRLRQPVFTLFSRSLYRTRVLPHLTILTDRELIFIGEDQRTAEVRGERHGGVWQYLPLRHIAEATVGESEDLLLLSLRLSPGGHRLEKRFAATFLEELTNLRSQIGANEA